MTRESAMGQDSFGQALDCNLVKGLVEMCRPGGYSTLSWAFLMYALWNCKPRCDVTHCRFKCVWIYLVDNGNGG